MSCPAIKKKKITKHTKWQKTQYEETKPASEPGMAQTMQLSDQEFKTAMFNILRVLVDTVDRCKKKKKKTQMGNVSREMEMLRSKQKEMLEIKSTITDMKNAFDGLICR